MEGTRLSHFRLISKVGEGGMAVVYKAEDEKLCRPVALKVLPPAFLGDEKRLRRFLREARAAAAINHPNIAAVHEVDDDSGVVFITMEYVEGKTLAEVLGGRALPVETALGMVRQITLGLDAMYGARICAVLGDTDQAFEWLERAYEERSSYLVTLKVDAMFAGLRQDPRYHDLLRRLQL